MSVSKAIVSMVCVAGLAAAAQAQSSLTLFHNNDGESKLLGSNGFGGFDSFLGELNQARDAATTAGRDTLTISSGDNFLAGLAFQASQQRVGGSPAGSIDPINQNYYDALALSATGYDAITLGNHDFDFGPTVLDDFIGGYRNAGGAAPFLSANLDFSGDANLNTRVTNGDIAASTVVTATSGTQYGIIGVTTPRLPQISSPGGVAPTGNDLASVAAAINSEVNSLTTGGVNHIILSGHLQALSQDQDLVSMLSGVDVIIAGGGSDLLKNTPDDLTNNPFQPDIDGPYPIVSTNTDADGRNVALVTTVGEYRYLGELEVEFDLAGNVTAAGGIQFDANGNPITPITRTGDAILIDPATSPKATGTFNGIDIQNDILNPLAADVASLEAQVVGSTSVSLDGRRSSVRTKQTNLGSLITDAYLDRAQEAGGLTGDPVIAVTNGGGIRNDSVISPGALTAGDVINILPFANSLVVLNGLTVPDLVSALEHAVSEVENEDGRFLQIGGFSFVYDENTGEVLEVALESGATLFTQTDGDLFGGTLDLVTNSFTGAGGDGFDEFAALSGFDTGIAYADVLRDFIEDELSGVVTQAAYPMVQNVIIAIPEPGTWILAALGGLVAFGGRRRSAA